MIPVLTAAQVREADAATIAAQGISSLELMERAATRCAERILMRHRAGDLGPPDALAYVVLAGMGNNGGDGLVIARLLHGAGVPVRVVRVRHRAEPSADQAANWARLQGLAIPTTDHTGEEPLAFASGEVIIDAILGIGARGSSTLLRAVAQAVRQAHRPVIAVDMPSGLPSDPDGPVDPHDVVPATWTITFEVPKLALLMPDHAAFTGHWEVISIGLEQAFITTLPTRHHVFQADDAVRLLPGRPRAGHKGTFGHALVVGGSPGRAGAMVLATRAALRSGAGLVTAHVPEVAVPVLQTRCPEAMCTFTRHAAVVSDLPAGPWSAVGIGPGLGTHGDSAQVIKRLLQDAPGPLVIDADGLNILAENRTWLAFLPPLTILTPHPKEFDRLYGAPAATSAERLERAREMAVRHNAVVVLKGAFTAVCDPQGGVTFNATGNPGMARGGSGDALTGLLTGLLAQGMHPVAAARLGVWLHGLAGDVAGGDLGMDGMTAMDLVEALPAAWQRLRTHPTERPTA